MNISETRIAWFALQLTRAILSQVGGGIGSPGLVDRGARKLTLTPEWLLKKEKKRKSAYI